MCGIFWYFGKKDLEIENILVSWLKKLEYRGYDSFWFSFFNKDEKSFEIIKKVWKISEFTEINHKKSNIWIWHSRWATHWKVNVENSHPHFSTEKDVVVVHNWIIENFEEIKTELKNEWFIFKSDTDTEVIPHLIKKYLELWAENAFKKMLKKVKWDFAISVMIKWENRLFVARNGSPLIIWIWENEYFLASDISAFLSKTKNVNYLDDYEMAVISEKWIAFENFKNGEKVEKRIIKLNISEEKVEKWDFDHFMMKEILEQKNTILASINQKDEEIEKIVNIIKNAKWTFFIWCWTAWKVCQVWEYFFADIAKKHINYCPASEFWLFTNFLNENSLVVAISQSGETADVIDAVKKAKKKWAKILSLINSQNSSLERLSDFYLNINAGLEIAVASTKATTAQMSLLLLLAFAIKWNLSDWKRILIETSEKINDMLNPRYFERIEDLADKIHKKNDIYIIWKSSNYPIAMEAAIKIQEISYIHAEGFAGWELKHWPIALITEDVPCMIICWNDESYWDIISNAQELKARWAFNIWISPENSNIFDFWIKIPKMKYTSPIINIIPVQILSYFLAIKKGLDPDKPRNLAKSVTVK